MAQVSRKYPSNIAIFRSAHVPLQNWRDANEGSNMSHSTQQLGIVTETGRLVGAEAGPRPSVGDVEPGANPHGIPDGFDFRIGVRSARNLRRLRRSLFGYEIYSGPAWEILLHLFESHVLDRRDTVGNVTDGTELPGATALRWMARLEQLALIRLRDDHLDRRRRWVELTGPGVELMTRYFSGAAPHPIAA
jgi:DNA-binding MarR family transcriptional regulator